MCSNEEDPIRHPPAATAVDSSSDEEDDLYLSLLGRDNLGSESNDPTEALLRRNAKYLINRCASLMQRVQGIMQHKAAQHVSRQLQAVLEHPGLNPNLKKYNHHHHHHHASSSSAYHHEALPPSQRLTKQSLAEIQFAGKLMSSIIQHSMGNKLDPNDDSATEESDADDDEVVLPDERIEPSESGNAPYLPAENNPFLEAIKLEKQYEARGASLDYSISECEDSLTKSLALKKHCKLRKPVFQLEKPSTSTKGINIPLNSTSSRKKLQGGDDDLLKGTLCSKSSTGCLDLSRMSDVMQRRSSLEQDKDKPKVSNGDGVNVNSSPTASATQVGTGEEPVAMEVDDQDDSQKTPGGSTNSSQAESSQESDSGGGSFIPTIKTLDAEGTSVVLDVAICSSSSDPTCSSSRCAAIKKPDKNRKVFQLGGIQNIFRDPDRLPTVRCTCFGRNELCALCLGRAKKTMEVNATWMSRREKLAILDQTFHKTLSFSEDVPLEVLLSSGAIGNSGVPVIPSSTNLQQLIKSRSRQFPPDFLETGEKPKKPRIYDIKPYEEVPNRSPKKDSRFSEETVTSPRKRAAPRKSQLSFDDEMAGKGLGWPTRERKDSVRRTRNQEFDIDNIVIPYSMAATTRVEQLVYKPIETPSWRVLQYLEIFAEEGNLDGELEDMSNAAFAHRHNKCEMTEKKRFTQALQKAINATRKSRRQDSTCKNEDPAPSQLPAGTSSSSGVDEKVDKENISVPGTSSQQDSSKEEKTKEKDTLSLPTGDDSGGGTCTPVTDNATVITEAMANQALKSLFKVGRRRTVSVSKAVEEKEKEKEEEPEPPVVQFIEPWPQRKFPLSETELNQMLEEMEKWYNEDDGPMDISPYNSSQEDESSMSPLFC